MMTEPNKPIKKTETQALVEQILTHLKAEQRLDLLPQLTRQLEEKVGQESHLIAWIVHLLEEEKKEAYLPEIVGELVKLAGRQNTEALVTSAIPLNNEETEALASVLQKWFKRIYQVKNRVDQSIIGGLVIQLDDQVIDLSLRKKLTRLQSELRPSFD